MHLYAKKVTKKQALAFSVKRCTYYLTLYPKISTTKKLSEEGGMDQTQLYSNRLFSIGGFDFTYIYYLSHCCVVEKCEKIVIYIKKRQFYIISSNKNKYEFY